MMLKIKQTKCLFVNFEKRKKNLTELEIFLFLNNKNKNRYMHIYRQTDRQRDFYQFKQRKNAQKKRTYNLTLR